MVQRKYLCTAPGQPEWEEKGKALLKSLKGDVYARNRVLQQTLESLRAMNLDKKRSGPGRKSNAERAVSFYEYVLAENSKLIGPTAKEENGESPNNPVPPEELKKEQVLAEGAEHFANSKKIKPRRSVAHEKGSDDDSAQTMSTTEFLNQHNDLCQVCILGGELLCCSTCNSAYHLQCVIPKLRGMPPDDWSCAYCVIDGVGGHKRKSATWKTNATAVREMDRIRAKAREREGLPAEHNTNISDEKTNQENTESGGSKGSTESDSKGKKQPPIESNEEDSHKAEKDDTKTAPNAENINSKSEPTSVELNSKDSDGEDTISDPGISNSVKRVNRDASSDLVDNCEKSSENEPNGGPIAAVLAKKDANENENENEDNLEPLFKEDDIDKDGQNDVDGKTKRKLELFKISDRLSPKMKVEPEVSRRRSRRPPAMFNPQVGPDSVWQSDRMTQWATNGEADDKSTPTILQAQAGDHDADSASAPISFVDTVTVPTASDETRALGMTNDTIAESQKAASKPDEPVFCNFCKDKAEIPVCVFCACRVCFGKHDNSMILLCDQCDDEYHIYCLVPPLPSVPTSKWYCPTCKALASTPLEGETAAKHSSLPPPTIEKLPLSGGTPSKAKKEKIKTPVPEAEMEPPKPKRGRPRKDTNIVKEKEAISPPPAKRRGRPPKHLSSPGALKTPPMKLNADGSIPKKRGRPPKNKSGLQVTSPKKSRSSISKQQPSDVATPGSPLGKRKNTKSTKETSTPPPKKSKSEVPPNRSADKDTMSSTSSVSSFGHTTTPIKTSRSGRMIKRNSFHDEIEEGEQHLRSVALKSYGRHDSFGQQQEELLSLSTSITSPKATKSQPPKAQTAANLVSAPAPTDEEKGKLKRKPPPTLETETPMKPPSAVPTKSSTTMAPVPAPSQAPVVDAGALSKILPPPPSLASTLETKPTNPLEGLISGVGRTPNKTANKPLPNANIAPPVVAAPFIPPTSLKSIVPKPKHTSMPRPTQTSPQKSTQTSVPKPKQTSVPKSVPAPAPAPVPVAAPVPVPTQMPKPVAIPTPPPTVSKDFNVSAPVESSPVTVVPIVHPATAQNVSPPAPVQQPPSKPQPKSSTASMASRVPPSDLLPTPSVTSATSSAAPPATPASTGDSTTKVPRRKPGARECMQISRRFGEQIIPEKYMETLLDYCTRGKVEHLIRMRERLDEHSRYLEAQLAGLEALVKEKGETNIVVPPLPEQFDKPAHDHHHQGQKNGNEKG